MQRTDTALCSLCEAACGLRVEHDGRRITSIRGNDRDIMSRGFLCPKGVALMDIQHDPERVREPLRRVGDRWEPVAWDEALADIGRRLAATRRDHGRDAVAFYYGNPTGHSLSGAMGMLYFRAFLGSRNVFSSTSVDALPRLFVSRMLYGNQAVIPVPDIDRTDFLLVFGANPVVSNGSAMRTPDIKNRLRALRERGGRLVVVDPRRSETAELADQHLAVRPGTDALLLAAMLFTLFEAGAVQTPAHVDGVSALQTALLPFTPERVAARVGLRAEEIRGLALDFARAPTAACYGRMGTCVQEFGALSTWLVDALNAVTGNLDRPGGSMFATPAADLAGFANLVGMRGSYAAYKSRVSGQPEFNLELPVAAFAEEMETPGPGQIRALVLHAGNPALSLPNGPRVAQAIAGLDLVVSIDIYRNETSGLAHYILPPTFGLEHDQFPMLSQALSIRDVAHFAPALLEAPPGCRHDYKIFGDIARATERAGRTLRGSAVAAAMTAFEALGPARALDVLLRLGPHRTSVSALRQNPDGIDFGPLVSRLPGVLGHPSKRVDLAPAALVADLGRLDARLAEPAEDGLVLISRRSLRSNNSWMHNSRRLVSGRPRCTLELHPDDASARGLGDGDAARLSSRVGEVTVPVEVTDRVAAGVVCLPHGWGHGRNGAALSTAAAQPGVSVNDVVDDARIDAVTGTSALHGVPVRVEPLGPPSKAR